MTDIKPDARPDDAVSTPDSNLRRHPRHLCIDGSVLRLAIRPEFRGRRALLVDVSAGGIGILLESPLEAGTVLAFELKSEDGAGPMARVARVRHSRPHPAPDNAPWLPRASALSGFFRRLVGRPARTVGQAWLVGCEFDRPLSDSEIQLVVQQLRAAANEPKT
jgi:hypothetical protein